MKQKKKIEKIIFLISFIFQSIHTILDYKIYEKLKSF